MKIGQFATLNSISIDTIRYYMYLKLLIPGKRGGQYEFDNSCQKDIEEIMWLKSADFSLNEIQRIFSLKRMTSLKSEEDMQYYLSLFGDKEKQLLEKRSEIDLILEKLNEKVRQLQSMKTMKTSGSRLGIPIELLGLFACPDCGATLKLRTGNIQDGTIMDGILECSSDNSCTNGSYVITDGILVAVAANAEGNIPAQAKHTHDKHSLGGHFIEQTSSDYVNLLYKSGQWIKAHLELDKPHAFVILEPGTGSGLFLHAVFEELPANCTYICVDHDFELLRNTKRTLDSCIHASRNHVNVLFLCCDFRQIPVNDASVDILLDHYGTTNFNFHNEGNLIHVLDKLVKPGGKWIGDYLCFKPGAKSLNQLDQRFHSFFYMDNIKRALAESCFKQIELAEMGTTKKGGIYETFFLEGDTLYDFTYLGQKPE